MIFGCPGVSVQRETEWGTGNGKYFSYDPEAVEAYFDIDFTSSEVVANVGVIKDVKQCRNGEVIYEGPVKFIIERTDPNHGYIGRKDPWQDTQDGDWNDDDVIVKSAQDCPSQDCPILSHDISFDQIQFPLAYNFPQDADTGVVERTFNQDAFMGDSTAALTERKFSLVDPKSNMALQVRECHRGLLVQRETEWWTGNGMYFSYNPEAVETYFDIDFTSSEVVADVGVIKDVKQCRNGEVIYVGPVKFIIERTDPNHGYIGRKDLLQLVLKPTSVLKLATSWI